MSLTDRPAKEDITFTMSGAAHAEAVLQFSAEHGFTRRTIESWNGEMMDAAIALHDRRLVGVIPFARRAIQVVGAANATCGYLSGVVIHDDFRGGGLGSRLLQYLFSSSAIDGLVVNSFVDDAAHRWYVRNGFGVAAEVRSVMRTRAVEPPPSASEWQSTEITNTELSSERSAMLERAFDARYRSAGGFEVRDTSFWNRRLKYHFYRAFNRYFLVSTPDASSYAIVGLNAHPSARGQLDVLELCCDRGQESAVLDGLRRLAADLGTDAIRFAVTLRSELDVFLDRMGYEESGRFDILMRETPGRRIDRTGWTFFMWDYA